MLEHWWQLSHACLAPINLACRWLHALFWPDNKQSLISSASLMLTMSRRNWVIWTSTGPHSLLKRLAESLYTNLLLCIWIEIALYGRQAISGTCFYGDCCFTYLCSHLYARTRISETFKVQFSVGQICIWPTRGKKWKRHFAYFLFKLKLWMLCCQCKVIVLVLLCGTDGQLIPLLRCVVILTDFCFHLY